MNEELDELMIQSRPMHAPQPDDSPVSQFESDGDGTNELATIGHVRYRTNERSEQRAAVAAFLFAKRPGWPYHPLSVRPPSPPLLS